MLPIHRRKFLVASVAVVTSSTMIQAASPVTYTSIHVQNMCCGECAKTIAKKLYAVPGVVEVRADVAKNVAYVVPGKEKKVSPKAIWNAILAAGFVPVKLESPDGVYTKLPSQ